MASDRLEVLETVKWCHAHAQAIQDLATAGHVESQRLIMCFKIWYAGEKLGAIKNPNDVEFIENVNQYKNAGYLP